MPEICEAGPRYVDGSEIFYEVDEETFEVYRVLRRGVEGDYFGLKPGNELKCICANLQEVISSVSGKRSLLRLW